MTDSFFAACALILLPLAMFGLYLQAKVIRSLRDLVQEYREHTDFLRKEWQAAERRNLSLEDVCVNPASYGGRRG